MPTKKTKTDFRIGMSGWTFPDWRGTFYPDKLKQKDELKYAATQLNSIEVNGTFYALQKPAVFENWSSQVPDDFVFSVKAPQYLTHIRRLKDFEGPLTYFLASGILHLKQKLGAILWQFPPNFALKDDRCELFLKELPKTVFEARAYVEERRESKKVRYEIDIDTDAPLHHVFEMRNKSFQTPEFVELLRAHGVAPVLGDSGGEWPYFDDQTADYMYLRLHGPEEKFPKGYGKKDIEQWAKKISTWADERKLKRIYTYFDTGHKLVAPQNALALSKLLLK